MCLLKMSNLMAIVPIAALLTASFFVLFTLRKIEEKGLRIFGCVAVALLWLATIVVFSGAVYKMAQGSVGMKGEMPHKMKMDYMSQMMQRANPPSMVMPGMVMPEKGSLTKDQKLPGCSKCQANKGVVSKTE